MEFQELQRIVESNSKAIQAMLEAQATDRLARDEWKQDIDRRMARLDDIVERLTVLNEGVVRLVSSLDDDRPTILGRPSRIENKVDRLLERE